MIEESEAKIKAAQDKAAEHATLLKSQDTLVETIRKQNEKLTAKIQ